MNEDLKKLDEALRPLDYKLFALFLVFLTLKLTGVINWSWWLILLPAFIIDALIVAVFGIVLFVGLIWLVIQFIMDTIPDKKEKLKK